MWILVEDMGGAYLKLPDAINARITNALTLSAYLALLNFAFTFSVKTLPKRFFVFLLKTPFVFIPKSLFVFIRKQNLFQVKNKTVIQAPIWGPILLPAILQNDLLSHL
jgi:hypothetical protein